MDRSLFKIIPFGLCILLSSCATVSRTAVFYRQANYEVKRKNYDAAFMRLKAILADGPYGGYAPKAAFGIGEYYIENNDYVDAMTAFYNYIITYPDDPGVIFAELILYKLSKQIETSRDITFRENDLIDSIRKKIFSKPMFFVFFENEKMFSYRSVFGNRYTAFDYVDRVEVMRNDKLFIKISP